jgi:hypothetical protein
LGFFFSGAAAHAVLATFLLCAVVMWGFAIIRRRRQLQES